MNTYEIEAESENAAIEAYQSGENISYETDTVDLEIVETIEVNS